jgi:hypothetical protein
MNIIFINLSSPRVEKAKKCVFCCLSSLVPIKRNTYNIPPYLFLMHWGQHWMLA